MPSTQKADFTSVQPHSPSDHIHCITMAEFKHGLFGCFDNVGLCVKAYFCPCVIFGQTAEVMGESCVTCGVCLVIGGPVAIYAMAKVRGLVREKSGIEVSSCSVTL